MASIPESIKRQIADPQPDWQQFRAVITGRAEPKRVHLAELFADEAMMQQISQNVLATEWVPAPTDRNRKQLERNLLCQIEYWHRMGYDYIRVSGGLDFPREHLNGSDGHRPWQPQETGPIQTWDQFERYPWPTVREENLWVYPFVAEHLPEGMGMMPCPASGFLEVPLNELIGYESLGLMMYDQPDLAAAVFKRVRELILRTYEQLMGIRQVVGCFQGDDMGFRTGTLMPPDFLRDHCLGGHRQLAELMHSHGKVYFLHSCGNLEQIMDELIEVVGIDAKHSFEDAIMPVEQAYDKYGSRIGLLGGVDVHLLAAADEQTVRRRTREIIDHCVSRGRYALGSGNTLADYCKLENVLAMFDEAHRWGR